MPAYSAESRIRHQDDGERAKRDVRRDGMKKIKAGALVTILYIAALIVVSVSGYKLTFRPIGLVPGLLPVAWLLAGVLEIAAGVPFDELSKRWDRLAGWQRGVIGVSVFLGGLLVLLVVCVIILFVLDWMSGTTRPMF